MLEEAEALIKSMEKAGNFFNLVFNKCRFLRNEIIIGMASDRFGDGNAISIPITMKINHIHNRKLTIGYYP